MNHPPGYVGAITAHSADCLPNSELSLTGACLLARTPGLNPVFTAADQQPLTVGVGAGIASVNLKP